jgi:hypothetical protein
MQQPPGQHEPPPQQLSSFDATGVAAVSVMSAARISKYFINPPVEVLFNLGFDERAEPMRRRTKLAEEVPADVQFEEETIGPALTMFGRRIPERVDGLTRCK